MNQGRYMLDFHPSCRLEINPYKIPLMEDLRIFIRAKGIIPNSIGLLRNSNNVETYEKCRT